MKRFLKKIMLAAVLCSVLPMLFTAAFFALASHSISVSYVAAIADKVERLESIDEPKIILVGNSNVAFGFDSETIEQAYDMPVVNMGLHGGIGNALIEEITQGYISEGDIVVLAHSAYNATTNELQDANLAIPMMISSSYVREIILQNNWYQVIKVLPSYMLEACIALLKGYEFNSVEYSRDSFNEYGDVGYERSGTTITFTEDSVRSFEVSAYEVERINAYNAYCDSVGATLVIAGYPIGDGEFTASIAEIEAFQATLEASMDCQVISDYTDYLIAYEYFYNSNMHLNDEGAAIRTAQLIEDLQAVIPQE